MMDQFLSPNSVSQLLFYYQEPEHVEPGTLSP